MSSFIDYEWREDSINNDFCVRVRKLAGIAKELRSGVSKGMYENERRSLKSKLNLKSSRVSGFNLFEFDF